MENGIRESSIKKLKLLVTVVDRQKAEYYLDVLSEFEVNFQLLVNGLGTARSEMIELLGLNKQKAVIFSVVREDLTGRILRLLDEKFHTIKKGKGVAFTVPMSSVIGVSLYQFLSNNRVHREE